jgi:menaquinol-cytochrome c reductase iron-sulfur subunit
MAQSSHSAYDEPQTPDEISRRTFMANAVVTMSGIIGVGLAIPIVGGLIPSGEEAQKGSWSSLSSTEFDELETATTTPVKLSFSMITKDAYLPPEKLEDYVWGVKVNPAKFRAARPDLFQTPGGDVDYPAVNMGFVVFSPLCPHLQCRYEWNASMNRFLCPCHGSQYNFDGAHIAGPAPRGLDPLPFREQSGVAQIMWVHFEPTTPDRIIISYQA